METIFVIKVGGNIIDHPDSLNQLLDAFAALDAPKILVHGGGKIASAIGKSMGIEPVYHEGRRITDEATLDLVTMVYAGLVNKKLVAALQSRQCNAIGLCGADANILLAQKRTAASIDYGFAGDIRSDGVNTSWLIQQLQNGICPILAPITHDGKGQLLNTNADTIARETAQALAQSANVQLVYGFEKQGVLRDPANEASAIPSINRSQYEELKAEGVISGGMIPKLDNAFKAIDCGVTKVSIGYAQHLSELINAQTGTQII
ncbi:acetylglutamate kinase [Rurimicrobium arvi]|uniref:Acetylglutamate kinase n=1 Tax=Rurimicrobium arvi TaxID=2049916 RepID=A0ABP8MTQ4_9BACT